MVIYLTRFVNAKNIRFTNRNNAIHKYGTEHYDTGLKNDRKLYPVPVMNEARVKANRRRVVSLEKRVFQRPFFKQLSATR